MRLEELRKLVRADAPPYRPPSEEDWKEFEEFWATWERVCELVEADAPVEEIRPVLVRLAELSMSGKEWVDDTLTDEPVNPRDLVVEALAEELHLIRWKILEGLSWSKNCNDTVEGGRGVLMIPYPGLNKGQKRALEEYARKVLARIREVTVV